MPRHRLSCDRHLPPDPRCRRVLHHGIRHGGQYGNVRPKWAAHRSHRRDHGCCHFTGVHGCTNDPDGKIARENTQRKVKEKKIAEEKEAKRRDEKKEAEELLAERRAKKVVEEMDKFEITFTGSNIESITQIMTNRMMASNTSISMTVGFDLKIYH